VKMRNVELHGGPLDGHEVSVPADALIYQSNKARGGAYIRDRRRSPDGSRWYWKPDSLRDRDE